jgi:hypothetical protein
MKNSIFIVINSGGTPANSQHLVNLRVTSGADFLRINRLHWAQVNLPIDSRIVIYQCGGRNARVKYHGASCFVAAGIVKEAAQPITSQHLSQYPESWDYSCLLFGAAELKGIIIYQCLKGIIAPLPAENIIRLPNQGINFIEVNPDEQRNTAVKPGGYEALDKWWNQNHQH